MAARTPFTLRWWPHAALIDPTAHQLLRLQPLALSLKDLMQQLPWLSTQWRVAVALPLSGLLLWMPRVLRSLQRPVISGSRAPLIPFPFTVPVASAPEFGRGMRAMQPAAAAAGAIMIAVVVWLSVRGLGAEESMSLVQGLPFLPFAAAFIATFFICRSDALTGRLEVIHTAPRHLLFAVTMMMLGWFVLFAPSMVAGVVLTVATSDEPHRILGPAAAALFALPSATVEGWLSTRQRHLLGVASAFPLVAAAFAFEERPATAVILTMLASWLPLAVAARSFAVPTDPVPSLGVRIALVAGGAAALFIGAPWSRVPEFHYLESFWLMLWLIVAAPLVDGRNHRSRLAVAGALALAVLAGAIAQSYSVPATTALVVGSVSVLSTGWLIDGRCSPLISLEVRSVIAYAAVFAALSPGLFRGFEPMRIYASDASFEFYRTAFLAASVVVALVIAWWNGNR